MLFERQEYQENCVNNIMEILAPSLDLGDFSPLKEMLAKFHTTADIRVKDLSDEPRLDILMETGTGKTFTYLKTMYELHKRYGLSKFIVFVPRLAIRAGIIQNIDLTSDYFDQEYGTRLKKHIYGDKMGLSQVEDYIRNENEFSVLILTSASIAASNSASSVLKTQQEDMIYEGKSPLARIAELAPIVFIDEPHLLKGQGFVKAYDKHFSNALLMRFGATFPEERGLSNVAFTLDSITAFRDYLVKKIRVSTVIDGAASLKFYKSGKKEKPLRIAYFKDGVEYESYLSLHDNIAAITGDTAHDFGVLRIEKGKVFISNGTQQDLSSDTYTLADDTIRTMIRRTIEIHFEKEERLFNQNIKTLSLFFIPEIADFRKGNPRVKKIFEEEYKEQRAKIIKKAKGAYKKYLERDYNENHELCVHEGYFSGDGKSKEEKENSGVDLILNAKTKLLSTDEPLRFIFSVWALQEGWDNPNIFNICKLASTEKEIKRKQQVGRGLRLAVDDTGKRQTITHCQDDKNSFYDINTLDVIVSGQEQGFIKGIQDEIIGSSITRNKLTRNALLALGLDSSQVNRLLTFLEDKGVITLTGDDVWDIQSPIADFLEQNKDLLPPALKGKYDLLVKEFRKASSFSIENRNKPSDTIGIRADKFREFEALWHTITSKAEIIYQPIDEEALIASIKNNFDGEEIAPVQRKVIKQIYDHANNQIINEREETLGIVDFFTTNNYAKFILDFSRKEGLPLHFCRKVFNALDKEKIKKDPRTSYDLLLKIIKDEIHKSIVQSIGYQFDCKIKVKAHGVFYAEDGTPREDIEATKIGNYTDKDTTPNSHYLYDKIVYDSSIEKEVISSDPKNIDNDKITVFAKLPKISIPTPYKSYSPDFAYFVEREDRKSLFLIVETKGYDKEGDIPPDEVKKIEYAEKFFATLQKQTDEVDIVYKKRINRGTLFDLLQNIGEGDYVG